MKFFIDTANLAQIKEAQDLGVLDGVTTNPSLQTKVFTLADIAEFVQNQTTVDTSSPFLITASAGGSSSYSSSKNTIYATWTGSNGTYELTLPSATTPAVLCTWTVRRPKVPLSIV